MGVIKGIIEWEDDDEIFRRHVRKTLEESEWINVEEEGDTTVVEEIQDD